MPRAEASPSSPDPSSYLSAIPQQSPSGSPESGSPPPPDLEPAHQAGLIPYHHAPVLARPVLAAGTMYTEDLRPYVRADRAAAAPTPEQLQRAAAAAAAAQENPYSIPQRTHTIRNLSGAILVLLLVTALGVGLKTQYGGGGSSAKKKRSKRRRVKRT